jgi:hypothetical protein
MTIRVLLADDQPLAPAALQMVYAACRETFTPERPQ